MLGDLFGKALQAAMPQRLEYKNCLFVLAHMRCGSTALSNVFCSRSDVSGYGETHIAYDSGNGPGRLAVNLLRRRRWKTNSGYIFDKILHSRLDCAAPDEFFRARAVFLLREPRATVASICKLYADIDRGDYRTPERALEYYIERVTALCALWDRFPHNLRIGLTHEELLEDPDGSLDLISSSLGIKPALQNRYVSFPESRNDGGGDPFVSGRNERIEPRLDSGRRTQDLEVPAILMNTADHKFRELHQRFSVVGSRINHPD